MRTEKTQELYRQRINLIYTLCGIEIKKRSEKINNNTETYNLRRSLSGFNDDFDVKTSRLENPHNIPYEILNLKPAITSNRMANLLKNAN
ncbi:MAG: hypothetical protein AABW50_00880 [Nanoarchaeota archaeon]